MPKVPKNVVVVGAGSAGVSIIKNLSAKLDPKEYNLILISSRSYFLHLIATIRMVVASDGKLEDRIAIPLDRIFVNNNGRLVVGTIVSISDEGEKGGHVTLASGETVDYSILVLATGSTWEGPLALPNGKTEFDEWVNTWRAKFEKAEDILLVGGGAVGVGTSHSSHSNPQYTYGSHRICRRDQRILPGTRNLQNILTLFASSHGFL